MSGTIDRPLFGAFPSEVLSRLFDWTPVVFFDAQGTILFASKPFCAIAGDNDLVGRNYCQMVSQSAPAAFLRGLAAAVACDGQWKSEIELRSLDGSPRWLNANVSSFAEQPGLYLAIHTDATSHKKGEQRLHGEQELTQQLAEQLSEKTAILQAALECSIDGMIMTDVDGMLLFANNNYCEILNISPERVLDPKERLIGIAANVANPQAFMDTIRALYRDQRKFVREEFEFTDGRSIERISTPIIRENGRHYGRLWTYRDITETKNGQRQVQYLAHHDSLTGLANRHGLKQHLEKVLAESSKPFALLYIDLDGFKLINDTKGHSMGDELLKQVAGRLRMVCERPGVFLARVGGDEFVCLLPEVSAELAQAFAQSLVQVLTDPYEFEGCYQHTIGASVGIALLPDHGSTAEEIMARADIALYSAKEAGKGTVHLFEFDMEHQVQGHVRLESELRESLENGEGLFVFYQPIVDAKTQKITTREALVRWHHKTEGWISPSKFVPIAEVRALIDKLGAFVLSRACHDAAGWSDGVSVAVNVSAVQLGKGLLMPVIQATLAESGLAPQRLEIEVTETALMRDEGKVVDELHQIRKLGVRVALDDFGTGYSSLSHLQAFPFDKIKIDGSFVQTLGKQSNSVTLVRAIAKIGRELGITTVAEGVETLDQLACVCAAGCTEFQGFLFGLPMPSERDAAEVAALDYNGLVKTEPSRASRRVFG